VTFFDGGVPIGSAALNGSAQGALNISTLSVATHSITAVYSGDVNFATSTSAALSQTVNRAASTTIVVSSLNPSEFGQSVTFTATVSSTAGGIPTGTVTFRDGTVDIGTAALNASGQAVFTTASLAIGAHNIRATYNGDTTYAGSSGTVSGRQTVNKSSTTTALTSTPNPSAVGQVVTFTAQVTSSTGGIPTGTVTFKDGNKTLGTATLNAAGQATFATAFTKKVTAKMTAVYGGTATFATSTSPLLNQVVQ